MAFQQRPKAKDGGPTLKRDQNNKLDREDAKKVVEELTKKLITEERAYKKDISYNARGHKRDFVVMVTLMQRNSVDGHIIIGEDETKGFEVMDARDPFKYRVYDFVEAPILSRNIPMRKADVGKQMASIFNMLFQYMVKLNIVDSV